MQFESGKSQHTSNERVTPIIMSRGKYNKIIILIILQLIIKLFINVSEKLIITK